MCKKNMSDYVLMGIIVFGLIFWIIIMPIAMAYGIVSGKLDTETLDPVSVQGQIIEENMIHKYLGCY